MMHVQLSSSGPKTECAHQAECLALMIKDALATVAAPSGKSRAFRPDVSDLAALVLAHHTSADENPNVSRRRDCTRACALRDMRAGS